MANATSEIASLWVDNAAGTLTNISTYVNNATLSGGQPLLDDTGLSDARHTFIPGLGVGSKIAANGWMNSTTEAIFAPLLDGTSVQKTVYAGLVSGQYVTGETYPEDVQLSAAAGALSTFSINFTAADGLTRTSVAPS